MANEQLFQVLADIVFWFHWFWILVILGGIFMAIKFKWYRPIHGAVMVTTLGSQLLFSGCSLAALEQNLRGMATGQKVEFQSGFIVYYFDKWLGIAPPTTALTVVSYLVAVFTIALIISWAINHRLARFNLSRAPLAPS